MLSTSRTPPHTHATPPRTLFTFTSVGVAHRWAHCGAAMFCAAYATARFPAGAHLCGDVRTCIYVYLPHLYSSLCILCPSPLPLLFIPYLLLYLCPLYCLSSLLPLLLAISSLTAPGLLLPPSCHSYSHKLSYPVYDVPATIAITISYHLVQPHYIYTLHVLYLKHIQRNRYYTFSLCRAIPASRRYTVCSLIYFLILSLIDVPTTLPYFYLIKPALCSHSRASVHSVCKTSLLSYVV